MASGRIRARPTQIDLTGPFFEYDPVKTLSENVQTMMEAFAREGEAEAKLLAAPHRKSGAFYDGIKGRVRSVAGKHWLRTAVVSETHVYDWKARGARGFQGRAEAQYRGGKLEAKYHMFRTTATRLRRSRAVNQAELTKGMN